MGRRWQRWIAPRELAAAAAVAAWSLGLRLPWYGWIALIWCVVALGDLWLLGRGTDGA